MKDHVFLVTACARKMQGNEKMHDTIYMILVVTHLPIEARGETPSM